MPTNLYGPNDNYHPENSHVLPALIRRFHEAKVNQAEEVKIWGTGTPLREFLYVDDLAEAALLVMQSYNEMGFLNIGYGSDLTIDALAHEIAKVVGFEGRIVFDSSKPDGTPKKLMDSTKMFNLGWKPKTNLEKGIALAYADFIQKHTTNKVS
jgi:GDP-L-fucose synthase